MVAHQNEKEQRMRNKHPLFLGPIQLSVVKGENKKYSHSKAIEFKNPFHPSQDN